DRGKLLETGVPGGAVDRTLVAVEEAVLARGVVLVVPLVVGAAVVRAVAVGPPAVHRLGGQLPLDVAHGAAVGLGRTGVGAVVAPDQGAGLGVVVDPERVAQTH